jgi:ATP-dependent helicase/nuclease subunit A
MAVTSALMPLEDEQAKASSPQAHVWLSASAGTGKTHVLSARVLRLLLAGVPPERILCLTFTRAGAAEMAERVHRRLAFWVQADSEVIAKDLIALGEDHSPEARTRARLLFASVLEATGGGLRIQTIHSFCQGLLAAFPLEAGLVPGFRLLDERSTADLRRETLIALVADAERTGKDDLIVALETLATRLGEEQTLKYLYGALRHAPSLAALDGIGLEPLLLERLGLPRDVDSALASACMEPERFPDATLGRIAAALTTWGTKTGLETADVIARWRGADGASRGPMIEPLRKTLLTWDKDEKRWNVKNRNSKPVLAAEPDYVDLADSIGTALLALEALPRQVAHAQLAAQGLHAARAFAQAYTVAKRQVGAVDYDDLIGRTAGLLTETGMADWIRYKLDQRTDHILVDEAQDTNGLQWKIVDAAADDFFEIDPDEGGRLRTLFAVGDEKQAIYGFQGTDPAAFGDAREWFRARARHTGQRFDALPLARSFRSVPAVLEAVDATLQVIGPAALGVTEMPPPHVSARRHPGAVVLLPPTRPERDMAAELEGNDGADDPTGDEDWLSDEVRRHAEKLANLVAHWLEKGLWLHGKGRMAQAGDVLILLRSRSAMARLIVARLHERKVKVAGVDRLRLQAPLAVQDLLAALRFAVQPNDDLNLASLLVSPLIGWTQHELMERIGGREAPTVWAHLRRTQDEALLTPLRAILADADFLTPHAMLERILSGPMDGRRRLLARLGQEARDPIDELLNAALAFEQDDQPALQRFIAWFDRDEGEIKRELAEQSDAVRVMTVHGAKGLQAPIVILADATRDPARLMRDTSLPFALTERATVPMLPARQGEAAPALAEAKQAGLTADMQEHWRLLYVAMTRAEDHLVITGSLGPIAKGHVPDESWYARAETALRNLGASPADEPVWDGGLGWFGPAGLPDATAKSRDASADRVEETSPLPAWLHARAPEEARPPKPLAPSAAIADDQPRPPPGPEQRAAAERGRLLHALFERLPELPPDRRRHAADQWLAQVGRLTDVSVRSLLTDHALAVIDRPEWADLFSPDALPEAPIAATVGGQVISGTVDRLLVRADRVDVIDFKTGMAVPPDAEHVPTSHIRQMAAYHAALSIIFPNRPVRAALLYTAGPRLILLPDAVMAMHKPGLEVEQQKLQPPA